VLNKLNKKSNRLNFFIILISIVGLVLYIVFVDGVENVLNIFLNCNRSWILFGFFIMCIYWYLEYYILNIGLDLLNSKLSFKNGMKNCILGQFFNNITPSATGGQFFQTFYMNKFCKIQYGVAVGALVIKFLCFQVALTLFCSLVLFFKFKYFVSKIQGFAILVFIGFTINVFVMVGLILIGFNKNISIFFIDLFEKILGKLKILQKTRKNLIDIKKEIDVFNQNILKAFQNKKILFKMLFYSFLQILSFYFVNVIIALIFDVKVSLMQTVNIICSAACVQMSTTFIPLPGAIGGAEVLFYLIYDGIFSSAKTNVALLTWRIYTFYFPIIVGVILLKFVNKDKKIELPIS
jgi:uncharacterized protein (TIRG00374 family)